MDYQCDVLVIGGGPAGMIAAGKAACLRRLPAQAGQAEAGTRVVLVEKNDKLGKKLLLTGHGRCNFTNVSHNLKELVAVYGRNGKFLFSALHQLGPAEVISFFESRGVATKVEAGGRVFPRSDVANDVLNVLKNYLRENKVEVMLGAEVVKFAVKNKKIHKVLLRDGSEIVADKYILSPGGKSFPVTGSTGEAYDWLREMGHTVIPPRPALVPIVCGDGSVRGLEGVSLKNVGVSVWQNNKKKLNSVGDAMFTSIGMSGPVIINMSGQIGELLTQGEVSLRLDFFPEVDLSELDMQLVRLLRGDGNRAVKNVLKILPEKLMTRLLAVAEFDWNKKAHAVTREERVRIIQLLKKFELPLKCVGGFNEAYATTGGVDVREVDPATIRSKVIANLFFAGEILNIDSPSGGYHLQVCWSTGVAAGAELKG